MGKWKKGRREEEGKGRDEEDEEKGRKKGKERWRTVERRSVKEEREGKGNRERQR